MEPNEVMAYRHAFNEARRRMELRRTAVYPPEQAEERHASLRVELVRDLTGDEKPSRDAVEAAIDDALSGRPPAC